jgi:hypothetical protein
MVFVSYNINKDSCMPDFRKNNLPSVSAVVVKATSSCRNKLYRLLSRRHVN